MTRDKQLISAGRRRVENLREPRDRFLRLGRHVRRARREGHVALELDDAMGGIEVDQIRVFVRKILKLVAQCRRQSRATGRAIHRFGVLAIQLIILSLKCRVLLLQVADEPLQVAAVLVEQRELILVRIGFSAGGRSVRLRLGKLLCQTIAVELESVVFFLGNTAGCEEKPQCSCTDDLCHPGHTYASMHRVRCKFPGMPSGPKYFAESVARSPTSRPSLRDSLPFARAMAQNLLTS